ncbi:hypothetical protein Dda_3217 [Drechslerella dactyloides]|uniref:Mitochondrial distribution and morphology protein 31 n=1 Tax=Drechslerella dactyloides TaxID=74499 RepID=A0AAD6J0X0_DREDA|nr:hypothetical protein Dda_3217 [Drechslerella dactyloides]
MPRVDVEEEQQDAEADDGSLHLSTVSLLSIHIQVNWEKVTYVGLVVFGNLQPVEQQMAVDLRLDEHEVDEEDDKVVLDVLVGKVLAARALRQAHGAARLAVVGGLRGRVEDRHGYDIVVASRLGEFVWWRDRNQGCGPIRLKYFTPDDAIATSPPAQNPTNGDDTNISLLLLSSSITISSPHGGLHRTNIHRRRQCPPVDALRPTMTTAASTARQLWQTARRLWHATAPPPPFSVPAPPPQHPRPFPTLFFFAAARPSRASPRYVLSRGFASGLFAWSSLPSKASETTAAVVTSCSAPSTVGGNVNVNVNVTASGRRKLRDRTHREVLYPLANAIWRRGVCTDCRKDGILRMSRRSASSTTYQTRANGKTNGKHGGGNGRSLRRDKNGDAKDYLRGSRQQQQQLDKGNGKSAVAGAVSSSAGGKLPDPKNSKPAPDPPKNPKDDEPKSPSSLAAAAAAIARRAARDHGFMERLPQIHRPSKEELLAAASSAWDRLRIRFKWLTIRQIRPFNLDEISAFFSWIILGNLAWIILGTTTFFSITIWLVNTVFAQEHLAKVVGNYLTQEMGMKVVFESAIVPRWKDGCISFKKVFVSRRPGILKGRNVEKGSSSIAAAAAAAAAFSEGHAGTADEEDDGNYTQFDVTIDTVNVTISLARWMNGRGLLVDVDMNGVRGVVDRTHLRFDPDVDPRTYRYAHTVGDFELDRFKLEDLLVTVYQPDGFRPFHVSIFSCDLPQLRKRWLFYDFLSASHVSGSYDDSLFTLHPRQTHGPTVPQDSVTVSAESPEATAYPWKKTSRFRIDGLRFDHLNRGYEGPLSWIVAGNLDIVADIYFPEDSAEGISKFMHDVMEKMETSIAVRREKLTNMMAVSAPDLSYENISGLIGAAVGLTEDDSGGSSGVVANTLSLEGEGYTTAILHEEDHLRTFEEATSTNAYTDMDGVDEMHADGGSSTTTATTTMSDESKFMMMDLRLQMNDTRAAIPLFTQDLSYRNNALMRPIVAYINSQRTIIPINCRLVKRVKEFDGSWTLFDSGLMDDLSAEVYDAFVRDIADADIKKRRMRAVGLWSLQVFMNAFLAAMAGTMLA